jgi:alkylation response protein AidB-like acyl-CoA dehydrogenase
VRFAVTDSERRLQEEVREFLAREGLDARGLPHALDDRIEVLRRWQARCHEAGYVGRAWPREFGGGGAPAAEQIVIDQELAAAGAPEFVNVVGLDVLGPSLLRFGSDQQRARYIPPILSAEEIWCQGFSEPEAGSDLASLRTRAVDHDDHFVVSGQKTWVSWGQFARWCGVLARTEDDGPKHRGISMLIVDMRAPGVELRPMTQITGHAEFCELFLDDVVVPKENLLAQRGDGWKIAMHTLGHERGTAALPRQVKLRSWLDRAVRLAAERRLDGEALIDDPHVQVALARALIDIEVLRHHAYRTVGEFLNGGAVGPDSSSVKLLMAQAEQRLAATAVDVLGPTLQHGEPDQLAENDFWYETYLYSRAATIYGGTQQIQRDIIAGRVLGLPQE